MTKKKNKVTTKKKRMKNNTKVDKNGTNGEGECNSRKKEISLRQTSYGKVTVELCVDLPMDVGYT